jgi:hypothetical protein
MLQFIQGREDVLHNFKMQLLRTRNSLTLKTSSSDLLGISNIIIYGTIIIQILMYKERWFMG